MILMDAMLYVIFDLMLVIMLHILKRDEAYSFSKGEIDKLLFIVMLLSLGNVVVKIMKYALVKKITHKLCD